MPVYRTQCKSCFEQGDIFRRIAERDDLPLCSCGGELQRILTPPMVSVEITPYKSPATGKYITSRAEMREDLRRSGSIHYEKGIESDIARNKEASIERAFAPIAAGVDKTVSAMVQSGHLET